MADELKSFILTGDDFGRSHEVNEAIERCVEAGVLTQASLMVNEPCVEEALRIARRHPQLCVGLHLTLCAGRASQQSSLTDSDVMLEASPARAGLAYAFRRKLLPDLEAEIARQFDAFLKLGFKPAYWDGHTHLHLHPVILRLSVPIAHRANFRFTRLVREPGKWALLPAVFQALSNRAVPILARNGIQYADAVFGLRNSGKMTTARFLEHLNLAPGGLTEIYFHPGAEPEALDLPTVRQALDGWDRTNAGQLRDRTDLQQTGTA